MHKSHSFSHFWKNPLLKLQGGSRGQTRWEMGVGTRLAIQSHRHDKDLGRPKQYGDKEDF